MPTYTLASAGPGSIFSMAFESALSFLTKLEHACGLDEFPKYRQENAGKSESPYLLLFVGFTLSVYVMETYLDLRQHRNLKAKAPPSALLDVLKTVDEDNKGLEAVSKVSREGKKKRKKVGGHYFGCWLFRRLSRAQPFSLLFSHNVVVIYVCYSVARETKPCVLLLAVYAARNPS